MNETQTQTAAGHVWPKIELVSPETCARRVPGQTLEKAFQRALDSRTPRWPEDFRVGIVTHTFQLGVMGDRSEDLL